MKKTNGKLIMDQLYKPLVLFLCRANGIAYPEYRSTFAGKFDRFLNGLVYGHEIYTDGPGIRRSGRYWIKAGSLCSSRNEWVGGMDIVETIICIPPNLSA